MAEPDVIPTSASIASTGQSIRYIGEHAYALSGLIAANTADQEALNFTSSGGGYIYGYIQLNGAVDDDSPAATALTSLRVTFNGIGVFILVTGDGAHRSSRSVRQKIVIPPDTAVVAILDSESIAADKYSSVVLTGRVYGAE